MLWIVCIESVPQNPRILWDTGVGDGDGVSSFLKGWSFQFVLPALPTVPCYAYFFFFPLMDHVAQDNSVLRVSPCLNGNSPQCRSTARVLLGNVSKFISQQVRSWDSNPDSVAAWPLLLLSAAYSYKHWQEDNSLNTSCSQPFGF